MLLRLFAVALIVQGALNSGTSKSLGDPKQRTCRKAIFDGQVSAGQRYEKRFSPGLRFLLEPLRSGWIIRVLPDGQRGAHDYAELATPPYQSVNPLLISTDWSFRAQDAIAWNTRRFQYAKDKTVAKTLEILQSEVLSGNQANTVQIASLVVEQPQGTLKILDSRFAPGLADQARMASAVALHLSTTPHTVDASAPTSPLGKLEELRFRAELNLPDGKPPVMGIRTERCTL